MPTSRWLTLPKIVPPQQAAYPGWILVEGGTAWCKWQVGDIVGAGLISFGDEGVTQEQLFYF